MKNKYFYLGLIIFYLIITFAPNKLIYFSAYFVAIFLFYKQTKIIRQALTYSLILSLFSEMGVAFAWFQMNPSDFNLGSGWFISPMTLITVILIPLSLIKPGKLINKADLLVVIFFFVSFISFFIFPNNNSLFGLISLAEVILVYFIFRINLDKKMIPDIQIILISFLIFESVLGFIQFLFKRPIGLLAEGILSAYQFGLTASENENLFRISGTFTHPNFYASVLLVLSPFLFLYPIKNRIITFLKILSVIVLIFSYSRIAWIIMVFYLVVWLNRTKPIQLINMLRNKLTVLLIFSIVILIIPFFLLRLDTIPQTFDEWGSIGVRLKTYDEAISISTQYPLTGVGLNNALPYYATYPVTNLFQNTPVSSFYKIHNLFAEIGAEIGIPGLFIFILFLMYTFGFYFSHEKSTFKNAAAIGLLGLIGISMLNPFFHTSQFRLFFLLAAIILA